MQENTPMRTILIFLAIIAISVKCKKEAGERYKAIEGRWMKTETLMSPGPFGVWEEYKGEAAYLIIRQNGEIEPDGAPVIDAKYNRYRLKGAYITFFKAATTDSVQMTYRVEDDKLIINPPCIEPCGIKLKRVN
jgi:hypothetical protein